MSDDLINNPTAAAPTEQPQGASVNADWLRYANQKAVRNQPLSGDLVSALGFLPDMGIQMEVFSGGQPRKGTSNKRVGSVRHDDGGAADVFFYKDGRKLDWANDADLPVFQEIVQKARANGVTGMGAGEGYMRPGSMHIGFGTEAVWGAEGKGANAPQWLRDAYNGVTTGKVPPHSYQDAVNAVDPTGHLTAPAIDAIQNSPVSTFRSIADDKDQEAVAEENTVSWWDGAKMAANEEWIGTNLARQMGREEFTPDPEFRLSEDLWNELTDDLDEVYQNGILSASSEAHARALSDQMRREQQIDRDLGGLGLGGTGLRLGAAILDPVAIAVSAASQGTVAPIVYGAKVGRMGRALRAGVAAGATNAGIDGYLASQDQTMGWQDVATSAAAGFILGGTMGALSGRIPEDKAMAAALQKAEGENLKQFAGGSADGSLGAARVPQEADLAPAEQVASESVSAPTTAMGSARIDRSAVLKKSDSDIMRRVGGGLIEDGVGNADGSTNRFSVSEKVAREERVRNARCYRVYNTAYSDWLKDQGKRLFWQHGVQERQEFNRAVSLAVRREIDAGPNKHVNAVASQMKKEFADLLEFGKQQGIRGFEDIKANHNYMVRRHRIERIDELVQDFGEGNINRLVGEAIQRANRKWRNANPGRATSVDEIDYEDALKIAASYTKSIRSRRYGEFNLNRAIAGQDMDTLKMMLDDAGMSSDDITRITDKIRSDADGGDRGRIGSAKWRLDLDETYRTRMIDRNGVEREIGIEDMLENDAEQLFGQYVRSVSAAGHMEDFLKEFRVRDAEGNLPVHAPSFETVKGYIATEAGTKGIPSNKLQAEMRVLDNSYKLVHGIPIEAPSEARAWLRILRDYNFSRIGGQLGVAQLAELGNIVGQGGLRVLVQNMPALRRIFANAKTGKFSDEFLNEIEAIWGFGTDLERMNMSAMFDEAGAVEAASNRQRLDHSLQRAKKITVVGSGMAHVNMVLQRLNSRVLVQRFMDDATGKRDINPRRLRVMGVNDEMHPRIQAQLRKHVDQTEGLLGRKVSRINIEKWDDIDAKNAFINSVDRWAKKSIQENDIGNMPDFMSKDLWKTVAQFRSFMMAAYVKQTLAGLHHRDWETFASLSATMMFGGLFYVAQTHVNAIGRDDRRDFLEERLSMEALASASFQRSGFSSVVPIAVDTGLSAAGIDPIFDFRSSGLKSGGLTPTSAALSNPTGDLIDGVNRGIAGIADAARGGTFGENDFKALTKLLVFQNMFGVRNVIAAVGGTMPNY